MNRRLRPARAAIGVSVLITLLAAPAGGAARPNKSRALARGAVSGVITHLSARSVTLQTPGRRTGLINVLTRAAARITRQSYPYVYGGGHEHAGRASVGIPGSGYNGRRRGFDCSGSVAAVLAAGGLWPAGSGVPNETGMIAQLMSRHLIARGAGRGSLQVTLYEDPGVHIFMNIDGRFFGTSDGGGGGNPRGGAGWLDDGAPDATTPWYKRFHVLPSVLRANRGAGHSVTFQSGAWSTAMTQLRPGEKVRIAYRESRIGSLIATRIGFPGASTVTGTIAAVGAAGRSFTVQRGDGSALRLSLAGNGALLGGIALGGTVHVTYVRRGSRLIARLVSAHRPGPDVWGGGWRGNR